MAAVPLLAGCARTVAIEVPAVPAVAIEGTDVAVQVDDRECRDVADALVAAINGVDGIGVDPRSEVRIQVVECGRALEAAVDVRLEQERERRRLSLSGRAHAVAVVWVEGTAQAHLVGSARHFDSGSWGEIDALGKRRSMDRTLTRLLAADLARQVSPMPYLAHRRVYPNAGEGTARRLHSQAVGAERRGDLAEAYRLALEAFRQRPSGRTAAYVRELETRLHIE